MKKVRFRIPAQKMTYFSKEFQQYRVLCEQVFDILLPEVVNSNSPDVVITCWADQFAEFIILRYHLKMQNQFVFLDPVLIPTERKPHRASQHFTFDVTKDFR